MNSTEQVTNWTYYPMGPNVRKYLSIEQSDYHGNETKIISPELKAQFENFFLSFQPHDLLLQGDLLVDLLDELIAMNLPHLALTLFENNQSQFPYNDFRANLAVAIAAMLTGDFGTAEEYFVHAQEINPQEPAPYINLAQLALHQKDFDFAFETCMQGFKAEKNNLKLWQVFSDAIAHLPELTRHETLKNTASKMGSWAGYSLLFHLDPQITPEEKLDIYSRLSASGEKSGSFLVEYTSLLGQVGNFNDIVLRVWEADKTLAAACPWQLYVHGTQAAIQLNDKENSLRFWQKTKNAQGIPQEFLQELEQLKNEIEAIGVT